jgi:NitT/TauT family transport system ATP-binding protein
MIAERRNPDPGAASAAPPTYELQGVGKVYSNGLEALRAVDLSLPRASFSSVIGSSGCGKSTLLKIMAGLTSPSEGSVYLADRPVHGPREDIGMMFQQATLFPWRTTLDNILLPIQIRGGRKSAGAKRSDAIELMKLVGLEGFESSYPTQLSGGMAQRAAICRMLITEPAVLLLDEPFSALDEIVRDFMNMELQRICMKREATAFLVTHSISEAVLLSETVYVMAPRPGRIVRAVNIDLPRPRTLDMMNSPKFGSYVSEIRNLLGEEMNP